MRQGTITLLYKKGDTRDVRNYRPITLLNTDYKLYAACLAQRLSGAASRFVSPTQLGFVPRRVITESSHLTKLLQAYLEENDEPGLLLALDWEKAFDRCSWEFLHEALRALGFGPRFRRALMACSNPAAPPQRVVSLNGAHSRPFHLHSGVPQGCPLSPSIFLVFIEALSRAVLADPRLPGIRAGEESHKLTQFADDTLLFLNDYSELPHVWALLESFERASGFKLNRHKTEIVRCGPLKHTPPPEGSGLAPMPDNGWVRLLGIPHWEGRNQDPFWRDHYAKVKGRLA